jgi:Glycosyl hydrolase family 9
MHVMSAACPDRLTNKHLANCHFGGSSQEPPYGSTDCGVAHQQQGYEAANQTKYAREAIKWGADYLMKAHIDQDTFVAQVGSPLIDGELRIGSCLMLCIWSRWHHAEFEAHLAVVHL